MGTDDPIVDEEYYTYSDDAVTEAFEHYLEIRGEGHTGNEYSNRRYAFTAGMNTGFHLAMLQRARVESKLGRPAPPVPDVSHETTPGGDGNMLGFRHVSEGWKITADPCIFGGVFQVTLAHDGIVRVLNVNGNMIEIDSQHLRIGQAHHGG